MLRNAGSARWVEAPTIHVPSAVTENCSDDEDPFGHGGALEAEEESCASTQRQMHRVKRLVLGNGVVRHSHVSWLWEVWRTEHVSTKTADEGL